MTTAQDPVKFDTSSHSEFVDYYEKESLSEATRNRFLAIRARVCGLARRNRPANTPLSALDIGCGTGMQCLLWASEGDRAYGIDINAPLIEIGRKRAAAEKLEIRFDVGSATALPYEDGSKDVCLMPELLEHVRDWEGCVREAIRVLGAEGVLYLSTTNYLCPVQHEFNLWLYAWYPTAIKRRYERLAVTTRPEIANYAKYPAVNWFSYYSLARYLRKHGFSCFDRFDMIDEGSLSPLKRMLVTLVKRSRLLRFLGHVCTPGTVVFAVKR